MRKLIFLVAAIAMFSCATKKTKTAGNATSQTIETAQNSNIAFLFLQFPINLGHSSFDAFDGNPSHNRHIAV